MVQFKDEQQKDIEYFLDTPMLSKPFIQINEGLVVLSKHILRASLSGLVPSLLKKDLGSAYKDKFGKAMENYIETLLTEIFPNVKTERQIKELYRKHQVSEKTKVVDFILEEDEGNVYIDSKAIEPDKTVKYSNTAVVIKQRLGNSFMKGVLQGLDCARTINKINGNKKSKRDSLIIITHMDHYISTGKTIEDMLDNSFFKMIEEKNGELPIDKERIYYMTIDEFEFMVEVCRLKKINITSIIDACSKDDSSSSTQKFNVMMHIHKIYPEGIPDREIIVKIRDYLFEDLIESMKNSKSYWDGRVSDYLTIKQFLLS